MKVFVMILLHVEQFELTYEGAFVKPAFSLLDRRGELCDMLLQALEDFECTSADLRFDNEGPSDSLTCDLDALDGTVTLRGDRLEFHCWEFDFASSGNITKVLENLWSGLAALRQGTAAETHSFLFEVDAGIDGLSYQDALNRFAPVPNPLPPGSETGVVYYLPAEADSGHRESNLVLNRSAAVEHGLQVNATLVYEGGATKPGAAILAANNRLDQLLRSLGLELVRD